MQDARGVIKDAVQLITAGELDKAQRELVAFLRAEPDNALGWYWLSYTLEEPRQQIYSLERSLVLDPSFRPGRNRLDRINGDLNGGKIDAALPPSDQALPLTAPVEVTQKAKAETKSTDVQRRSPKLKPTGGFWNLTRYVLRRSLTILATIVIGIYLTVLITNKGGQIDQDVQQQINTQIIRMRYNSGFLDDMDEEERKEYLEVTREEMEIEAGMHLPLPLRNLRWTLNSLTFEWGKVMYLRHLNLANTSTDEIDQVNALVLQYLPNTILLFGVANLIVFMLGIPLALYLAEQGKGGFLDRIMTLILPLSSVPSWVHGIILVTIFAVILKVLPLGGKYDILPPETKWGYIPIVARHMVLPVAAIVLSVFFQLVYSWRTFLLIYSEEDYVELGIAKGLSPRTLGVRYILRPTMPYVLTSFALTLVGFWQMATALEHFFNWPGIGALYVKALPHFWGENFFPGEVSIILSVVVLFAYMLGLVVFLLDVFYAVLDPRVRIDGGNHAESLDHRKHNRGGWLGRWRRGIRTRQGAAGGAQSVNAEQTPPKPAGERLRTFWVNSKIAVAGAAGWMKNLLREIVKYPSAVLGLMIILGFVGISLYAVIALPFMEIGSEWRGSNITEMRYLPKNVPAKWANWFRRDELPTTFIFRSGSEREEDETDIFQKTWVESDKILFNVSFDYPYTEFPQDVFLYLDSQYHEKKPFFSIRWITPDGREISPRSPTGSGTTTFILSDGISPRREIRGNEQWKKWFVTTGQSQTPPFYVLFADPDADIPRALPGTYTLEITVQTFEEQSDVELELVVFGRVHGWAGTDNLRRDLIVPLLWGAPFTLAFGVLGAILITILAMLIAAAAVWFGGAWDSGMQRLTEANMILPVLAVGILVYAYFDVSLWTIMGVIILLMVFGSPTKSFRAAFMQVRNAPYIEAARAYGASNSRIIFVYMIPKIIPVLIPQLVTLIPALVFLEATLGIFNVYDPRYPTWGRVIYEAITRSALWGGSAYWVLEPIILLLLVGVSFALVGFALERILNPRLQQK